METKETVQIKNLMDFYKSTKPTITEGRKCKMIKQAWLGNGGVGSGGEFIAKVIGEYVIFWNAKAGANWHFEVPIIESDVMKAYFIKL